MPSGFLRRYIGKLTGKAATGQSAGPEPAGPADAIEPGPEPVQPVPALPARHDRRPAPERFRCPTELQAAGLDRGRIATIGPCFAINWAHAPYLDEAGLNAEIDFVLFGNLAPLPEEPPAAVADYKFQVVQLQLRHAIRDLEYFFLEYDDVAEYERIFVQAKEIVGIQLDIVLAWNTKYKMLTFVMGFLVPQQNPYGRLMPRNDLRNMVYFIEQLNAYIVERIASIENVYYLDIDQIASSIGKQYVQDDSLLQLNQGFTLPDEDREVDGGRLEPAGSPNESFSNRTAEFSRAIWFELAASYRSITGLDAIKAVVIDLDDTLWRGVLAEYDRVPDNHGEGWPTGFMEALLYAKKRGILLAISSKNEASRIAELWPAATGNHIRLEDFASVKINWNPKIDNIREIIQEFNILPKNVLFIDDNPVERASVTEAIPGIRVLGRDLYHLRRTLLWAPEMQSAHISRESTNRTSMIRAQIKREEERSTFSREDFLANLGLRVRLTSIARSDDGLFKRAFELLNKTNQFNTTGKRWSLEEMTRYLDAGGRMEAFSVRDKYTDYGLVGTLLIRDDAITQMAMSCRVVGLDVEIAVLHQLANLALADGRPVLTADFVDTPANLPCRTMYPRAGFETAEQGGYEKALAAASAIPSHIAMTADR